MSGRTLRRCDRCERREYAKLCSLDVMTQPNGRPCGGVFRDETAPVPVAIPPLRVGLDVDGVFVDFNGQPGGHGFVQELITAHGHNPFPQGPYHPTTFHYWKQVVRESDVAKAWAAVDASPDWWARLQPHDKAVRVLEWMRETTLVNGAWLNCRYLTARQSLSAARQTEEWLYRYGPRADVWANCDEAAKGYLCQALRLDVMVDDKLENLIAVRAACPTIHLFMVNRSWNTVHHDSQVEIQQITRIDLDELPTRLWNLQAARQVRLSPGASAGETTTPPSRSTRGTRGTGRTSTKPRGAGTTAGATRTKKKGKRKASR